MSEGMGGSGSSDGVQALTGFLRLLAQVVGLVLVLMGCYYGLGIIAAAIGFVRNPESLKEPAEAMAVALALEKVNVPLGEGGLLPAGRTLGTIGLLLWYFLSGVLSMTVVSVGGRMMTASFQERREFYGAVREMMLALRREQEQTRS